MKAVTINIESDGRVPEEIIQLAHFLSNKQKTSVVVINHHNVVIYEEDYYEEERCELGQSKVPTS